MFSEQYASLDYFANFKFLDSALRRSARGQLSYWTPLRWRSFAEVVDRAVIDLPGYAGAKPLTFRQAAAAVDADVRRHAPTELTDEILVSFEDAGSTLPGTLQGLKDILARHRGGRHVVGYYLHGSMAVPPRTPFSDVDDFIVVSNDALKRETDAVELLDVLYETAALYYQYDPYQHHRHFVVTDRMLDSYDESFMPLATLERALRVHGASSLRFRTIRSTQTAKIGLVSIVDYLQRCIDLKHANVTNRFALKELVSAVLLIPCLALATIGLYCFKGDSFDIARPKFRPDEWRAITVASHLRERWLGRPTRLERLTRGVCLNALHNIPLYEMAIRRTSARAHVEPDFSRALVCLVRGLRERWL